MEPAIRLGPEKARQVLVCRGTGCESQKANLIFLNLQKEMDRADLGGTVEVKFTGCHGFCQQGPTVMIMPAGTFYCNVSPDDIAEIVREDLQKGEPVERLLFMDPKTNDRVLNYRDINYFVPQRRIVLRNCGFINPEDIDDYLAVGGYDGIKKALNMTQQEVIDEIKLSGLRGRGGAGFPTGMKWEFCNRSVADRKYIICNADEGDPGAFMDRAVLEGDPHSVLEGMMVAGYAIGAANAYVYVRAEYPMAYERTLTAIGQARERGFLDKNIFGSNFNFDIKVKLGAGAFVCGEETALMASIEGKRGMPNPKPPFPAVKGLFGKPTNINNVETLANIPVIMTKGGEWFASVGTEKSKGTKVFALAGKISYSGLVEIPMGTPLREIIENIGGGIPNKRKFKAAQTGGPSGGCIPAAHFDVPMDYENLTQLGAIMGSGGLIVTDENTCMVDMAKYFLTFTQKESCGKCIPCRLGTKKMLEILTDITTGKATMEDLDQLVELAEDVKDSSLCGLGQTCPNPVISTIKYFRDEYVAHIEEKRCPAAVCGSLVMSPCQHTCPAGIDVPTYLACIAEGKYVEAVEVIRERNPFPAICGRVCHHPCEGKCRRGELDAPVSIRFLKRFAADWWFKHIDELPEPFPVTKEQKVAVVGAGPCGLTCAYFLRKMGYRVTVFEALPVGGGVMALALPDFRLPRDVVEREIRYNSPIDVNRTVEDLRKEGYEAVFIGAGAAKIQRIGIPGEIDGLQGFCYGLSFLEDAKAGREVWVGKRVVVIGGGNTAMDSARTCLRLGAAEVNVYYRRTRQEMPVTDLEYEEAVDEGVKFHFLVSPTRIVSDNSTLKGLECIHMRLGTADETGRRRPVPIGGSEFFAPADVVDIHLRSTEAMVIPAVGQAPDLSFLPPDMKLELARWGALKVNWNTLCTNIPWLFAGGDFVTGPATVIQAVAAGRRGAIAIDKYLRKDPSRVEIPDERLEVVYKVTKGETITVQSMVQKRSHLFDPSQKAMVEEEGMGLKPRASILTLPPEQRIQGFDEIEISYSERQARDEARRCLRCDLER